MEPTVHDSTAQTFQGNDKARVDDKWRVLVPKQHRDILGSNFIMCLSNVQYILAYPRARWAEIVNRINEADDTCLAVQRYSDFLFGNSMNDLNFDSQGRVVIPQELRLAAKIKEKDVVVIRGNGKCLAIWSEEEYRKYLNDEENYNREFALKVEGWRREISLSAIAERSYPPSGRLTSQGLR